MLFVLENYGLSDVAILYTQSAVLGMTTVIAAGLVLKSFEQDSSTVKGVAVGSSIMMMGMVTLGFARAVVVWWWGLLDMAGGG